MKYLLADHGCETCNYLSSAFTLLRLPLDKFPTGHFKTDNLIDASTLIICHDLELTQQKKLLEAANKKNIAVISFNQQLHNDNNPSNPVAYLQPDFSKSDLENALHLCQETIDHDIDFSQLKNPIFEKLIGSSKQISRIKLMIKQVASSDSTVLIIGESGTGKDVIASCIHYLSNRNEHPIVPINCGAIPNELMESELFGHEKGAFTGAASKRAGRFEMANKGTLFLDEIGDMPLPMQVKLLRVIQERKLERVGGNTSIDVDVRLIAATNKSLESMIEQKLFREDLYYRINVFPIAVPSLREHPEDIPALINYHIDKIYSRLKYRVVFTDKALALLSEYRWPGNVRELQNFLERMVILYRNQVIDEKDLDPCYKQKHNKSISIQRDLVL